LSFSSGLLPLLYVVTSLIYFALAVPLGRLADVYGRGKVFLAGYALLIVVYAMLLLPTVGVAELILCLVLFGAYYAATDGVLMALASPLVPLDLRTSGIALLTTAIGLTRLFASVAFGALWTWWGIESAVAVYLAGLIVSILVTMLLFSRARLSLAAAA
jgi:MFS family permease